MFVLCSFVFLGGVCVMLLLRYSYSSCETYISNETKFLVLVCLFSLVVRGIGHLIENIYARFLFDLIVSVQISAVKWRQGNSG